MQKNKACLCCAERYSYCPSCSRADALKPSWASEFCSETCKDLWVTLTKFGMSMLTKAEAKSTISDLDLKPIDAYVACVKRDYTKVMEPEKKTKRGKRIEIKHIDEAIDIEPAVVETAVESIVEDTTHEVVNKENE